MNIETLPCGMARMWQRAVQIGLACLCMVALAACSRPPGGAATSAAIAPTDVRLSADQLRHVAVRTVTSIPIHTRIETTGTVDFDNDRATSVTAPFSGPVARVLVQPGQRVRKGEALAIVDSADFSAAIDAYAKAVVAAKNLRKIAAADADLAAHQGVSARENAQAQADAAGAESDRDAALQALVALGVDASTIAQVQAGQFKAKAQATIRAPIAGTVAEKLIAPGTLLQAGSTACFTLADLSQVWVLAQVSTADLKSVAVGDPVQVRADDGTPALAGVVDNIAAIVDPDTRAVLVRVRVDNPGGALKKQMYVRVQIRSQAAHSGLEAPASAILRDDENLPFVFVAAGNDRFARRHVNLGRRDGDSYEIVDGLRAGERIVVDGGLFMQFMQAQ